MYIYIYKHICFFIYYLYNIIYIYFLILKLLFKGFRMLEKLYSSRSGNNDKLEQTIQSYQ